MLFQTLGPLRVWDGTVWSPVRAAQQRVVLAVLLAEAGRVVATERLIAEIWGEQPPRAAGSVLRGYVMRLRRQIGPGHAGAALLTRTDGYELVVEEGAVDAAVFDHLVAAGRRALAGGDLGGGASRLAEALGLWHGPALGDVPAVPVVTAQAARLEQARLSVTEDWLGVQLDLGRHDEVIDDLNRLVAEQPLRERAWGCLMVALYRAGRRADALDAFQRARRLLVAELGLEPGPQLRELQHSILSDALPGPSSSVAAAPPPGWVVPAQLPADVAGFVGRERYLRRLDGCQAGGCLVGVTGSAGVGKTSLALRWTHRIADRFPDGQLYVNLHGFGPDEPMDPAEAIRGFLAGLGVPPARIPVGLQAQEGLYRSLLAGRRVLVVLDNARDAKQIRPLLPGSRTCLTVVTSRDELAGLAVTDGADLVPLELMSADEGRSLLVRRIGAERVAAAPRAVDEIIGYCAGLPLALAIVAARAATRPASDLAALVGELREQQGGLEAFASADPDSDVRAVFSWSYRALSAAAARLFRLLSAHPGADATLPAAASMVGLPPARTQRILAQLTGANLLAEHTPGRFIQHDLLRAFAAELADAVDSPQDRRAALHRILDHYLHTAHTAARFTDPHRDPLRLRDPQPGTFPERFTDDAHARAWLDAHQQVLIATVRGAEASGFDTHTWQLAWSVQGLLARHGRWQEQIAVQTSALAAAHRRQDRYAQAHAHHGLGNAHAWLSRYEDAHGHYNQALDLFGGLDAPADHGRVHGHVGWLLGRQDRHREALVHKGHALALYRVAGHLPGQARALNQLGWSYLLVGDYHQAVHHCREAFELLEQTGDRHGQGMAWDTFGYACHHLERHAEAVASYQRALALQREVGDRYNEAETLHHLGDTYEASGRVDDACIAWKQSQIILEDLGHSDAVVVAAKWRRLLHDPGRSLAESGG